MSIVQTAMQEIEERFVAWATSCLDIRASSRRRGRDARAVRPSTDGPGVCGGGQ
jgi:hypothetical protein